MRERAAALLRACLTRICSCVALTSLLRLRRSCATTTSSTTTTCWTCSRRRRPARTPAENQRWRCLGRRLRPRAGSGPRGLVTDRSRLHRQPQAKSRPAYQMQATRGPTVPRPHRRLPPMPPTASCFATRARRIHTSSPLLCGQHEGASNSDHSLSPSSLTTHVCGRNLECRQTHLEYPFACYIFPDTCWQKPSDQQTPCGHVCHRAQRTRSSRRPSSPPPRRQLSRPRRLATPGTPR